METNEIFKTTALLYVKDALDKQEYESCQQLIGLAKKFGAQQDDINEVIALYLQGNQSKKLNGASRINGSLRLINKEK